MRDRGCVCVCVRERARERERERERERVCFLEWFTDNQGDIKIELIDFGLLNIVMYGCRYVHVYACFHDSVKLYIYIYIYNSLNTLSGGKSCLVAPRVAVSP